MSKDYSRLLNQKFIAGIGNIYADEILYRAGIRPARRAESLKEKDLKNLLLAIKAVLKRAIQYRGSTIRDYRDGLGERAAFRISFASTAVAERNVYAAAAGFPA